MEAQRGREWLIPATSLMNSVATGLIIPRSNLISNMHG